VLNIAYLANQFPSTVEPYVMEEIAELRSRSISVLPGSARYPQCPPSAQLEQWPSETIYLQQIRVCALARALCLCGRELRKLKPFLDRILCRGSESLQVRSKALVHTLLGAYYAVLLSDRGVDHIHVHHGYFSAWIAMVAARLLGITYSLTLHGSDLLLNAPYLDTKLQHCAACFAISEFNRRYIFTRFPSIVRDKILLRRLGVDVPHKIPHAPARNNSAFTLLAVGRLHPVKDYTFLLAACALLKAKQSRVLCLIAGDGPEKRKLRKLCAKLGLQHEVSFLGHVAHEELAPLYSLADLFVLTSKSEGVPLALMEAMAFDKPVLAPKITGIPELVLNDHFLYQPGCLEDFVSKVELLRDSISALEPVTRAAHDWIDRAFNRTTNTRLFADSLTRIASQTRHANPVLQ
jgi:colanic acid/amylovoran biosynthesis glycosyltransferase